MFVDRDNFFSVLRIAEAIAIFVAIAAFIIDLSDRETDRAVRHATLIIELTKELEQANKKTREFVAEYRDKKIDRDLFFSKQRRVYLGVRYVVEVIADENFPLSEMDFDLADLSELDLRGSNFEKGFFQGANFTRANLSCRYYFICTSFRESDLSSAWFDGADLSGADLSYAHFEEAHLRNVDFSDADLSTAYLTNANIAGADLRDAMIWQRDIDEACASPSDRPPLLPANREWHGRACP